MIGWKPKFNDLNVASVRYRCLNPLAELQRGGYQIELFNEKHIKKYVTVIFSKLYDDHNYRLAIELKKQRKAVIFDICDNHFYNPYSLEKFKIVRQQLLRMLSISDLVVTSTETLADVLVQEAKLPRRPVVIGDAIEEKLLENSLHWMKPATWKSKFASLQNGTKTNLLWFGIHGGENAPYGMLDLLNKKNLLVEIQRIYPFRLIVASNSEEKFLQYIKPLPLESHYCEWDLTTFGELLAVADVCIIPITKNPFTLCKSNNRLATALYVGIPTIADAIPSYNDLSPFCVLDDWEGGLRMYFTNKDAARNHARPAREYIAARYTIKQIGAQWAEHISKMSP